MREQFNSRNLAEVGESPKRLTPQQMESEPPIKEGEIFDPEKELKEIRGGSKEGQRRKLKEFKEKLAYQKEGLAKMQEKLIQDIRANPDIARGDLSRKIKEFGERFGFTSHQENSANYVIDKYAKKHEAVRRTREEHPDDADLFTAVFGRSPKEKVEVIEGPMTLHFRCYNLLDYALIHSQAYMTGRELSPGDIIRAGATGGCASPFSRIPGLEGTITAENKVKAKTSLSITKFIVAGGAIEEENKEIAQGIYVHEEEHAIKRLFAETEFRENVFNKILDAETDAERRSLLRQYYRRKRQQYEALAKDEILAYLKEGRFSPETVFQILVALKIEGGIYDYSVKERESMGGLGSFNIKGGRHILLLMKLIIPEAIEEVFVTEYQKLIKNGINAFLDLRDKGGYSVEQTVAILIKESLVKWKKVVKRLLEVKR